MTNYEKQAEQADRMARDLYQKLRARFPDAIWVHDSFIVEIPRNKAKEAFQIWMEISDDHAKLNA